MQEPHRESIRSRAPLLRQRRGEAGAGAPGPLLWLPRDSPAPLQLPALGSSHSHCPFHGCSVSGWLGEGPWPRGPCVSPSLSSLPWIPESSRPDPLSGGGWRLALSLHGCGSLWRNLRRLRGVLGLAFSFLLVRGLFGTCRPLAFATSSEPYCLLCLESWKLLWSWVPGRCLLPGWH